MKNPIQWLEIATNDLERAQAFYQSVFNLEFQYVDMPGTKMYMFGALGQEGSSGCLLASETSKPSDMGTTVYFSCDDVSNELGRIEEAGGTIVLPKTDIGEFGFYAKVMDTEGNCIGLHSNQ